MTTDTLILREHSPLSKRSIWRLPPLGARGIRPGHTFVAVAGAELIEHLREMRLARGLALGALDPADVVVALIRRPTSRSTIFSGKNVSKRGPTEAVFGTFLPKSASERSGEPCAALAACRPGSAPRRLCAAPTAPHPATCRATPRFPSAPRSRPRAAPRRYDSQPTPHGRTPARFPSTGRPAHGHRNPR